MPSAINVKPNKWTNIQVLFDNGEYSVVMGDFEGTLCLGERWNGSENEVGYPNQGNNPLWHVIHEFFSIPILHKLLDLHLSTNTIDDEKINLILLALRKFQESN